MRRPALRKPPATRAIHAKQQFMNSRRNLTWSIAEALGSALDCAQLRAGNAQVQKPALDDSARKDAI
jgi:hypothetical protein